MCRSQKFCAIPKDDFHSEKFGFSAGTQVFEEALNVINFLGLLEKLGQAQKFLRPVEGQGIIAHKKCATLYQPKNDATKMCFISLHICTSFSSIGNNSTLLHHLIIRL